MANIADNTYEYFAKLITMEEAWIAQFNTVDDPNTTVDESAFLDEFNEGGFGAFLVKSAEMTSCAVLDMFASSLAKGINTSIPSYFSQMQDWTNKQIMLENYKAMLAEASKYTGQKAASMRLIADRALQEAAKIDTKYAGQLEANLLSAVGGDSKIGELLSKGLGGVIGAAVTVAHFSNEYDAAVAAGKSTSEVAELVWHDVSSAAATGVAGLFVTTSAAAASSGIVAILAEAVLAGAALGIAFEGGWQLGKYVERNYPSITDLISQGSIPRRLRRSFCFFPKVIFDNQYV